jgi:hypothetical protein
MNKIHHRIPSATATGAAMPTAAMERRTATTVVNCILNRIKGSKATLQRVFDVMEGIVWSLSDKRMYGLEEK